MLAVGNMKDRAELATEEYLPVTPGTILEDTGWSVLQATAPFPGNFLL